MASVNMSTTLSLHPPSEPSTQEPDQQARARARSHNTSTSSSSSSIILPTILSLILGSTIVLLTSPTIPQISLSSLTHAQRPTLLSLHAHLTDLTLIFLISFLTLCNHGPSARWIARNQSFPYSYSPSWNIGVESLNFQLIVFEIFHVGKTARSIHCAGIIVEQALWISLVHQTFGLWGLILLFALLTWQAWTYGTPRLTLAIVAANTLFTLISTSVSPRLLPLPAIELTAWTKALLFHTVTIRTLSHILEPLPPQYRASVAVFDDGFGAPGWRLCVSDPARALWLVVLGIVSEFGAGMPGRLFGVVVYKALWSVGGIQGDSSGTGLLGVDEAKVQAWRVVERGWMANDTTSQMYAWALSGGVVSIGGDGEKEFMHGDMDLV